MAQQLGLGPVVPSESGGLNYAVGGARTEDYDGGVIDALGLPDDVPQQVIAYLNNHTTGANDLLSGGQTDVTILVGNVVGFITNLYNAGGRSFVVPNFPPLAKSPVESADLTKRPLMPALLRSMAC